MKKLVLEACVATLEDALHAQRCGADRIELCSDLSVGGLTPSLELITACMNALTIPIVAMVRPRGGNFVYTLAEIAEMRTTIGRIKQAGVHGVVLGALTECGQVDIELTKKLVELAKPLSVTFHKAIDDTPDPVESAVRLTQIPGIQRVLSSGGKTTALQGANVLRKMQSALEQRINVIAAGKITNLNLRQVHAAVRAEEYHGQRIVF
jgi:copper homeostasis protein